MSELLGESFVAAHDRFQQWRELTDHPRVSGHHVAPRDQIACDRAQEQEIGSNRVEEEGRVGRREPLADESIACVEVDEAESERGARACHVRVYRLAFADIRRVRVRGVAIIRRSTACSFFVLESCE